MPGEMTVVENEDLILLEVSGETLPFMTINQKLTEAAKLAKGSNKGLLIIRRESTVHIGSYMEFFKYAELFDNTFDNRVALVYPKEMITEELDRFEVSTQNMKLKFKIFSTKKEAENWLTS